MVESSEQRPDEGTPVDEINEALLSVLGPAGATLPPQLVGRLLATSTAAGTGAAPDQATANAAASPTALLDAFIARRIAAPDAPATTPSAATPAATPDGAAIASDAPTATPAAQPPSAESVDAARVNPPRPDAARIAAPSAPEATDAAPEAIRSDRLAGEAPAARLASPQPDPSVRPFALGREPSVVPAGVLPDGTIDGSRDRDGLFNYTTAGVMGSNDTAEALRDRDGLPAAAHGGPSGPAVPAPQLGAAPSPVHRPGIEENVHTAGQTSGMPEPLGAGAPPGSERNPILGQPSLVVSPASVDRSGSVGVAAFVALDQEPASTTTGPATAPEVAERGVFPAQADGAGAAGPHAPTPSDVPLPLTGTLLASAPSPAAVTRPTVEHQPPATGASRAAQSVASAMAQAATGASAAQPVEQIAGALAMSIREGRTEVSISLRPATLGAVNVRIVAGQDGLVIHIAAERTEAGDLLRSQLVELRQALVNHQVPVAELHVLHNPPPAPAAGSEQPAPWTEERSTSRRESEQEGGRRRDEQDQDDDQAG